LQDGVRRAVACTEEPILALAQGHDLTFVATGGARLTLSWRFQLSTPVDGLVPFVIPQMIASHLVAAPMQAQEDVELVLQGGSVKLAAHDQSGPYELRWQFDLHAFPAPPETSHLLAFPSDPIRLDYLQFSDSVHQAVAKLIDLEREQHIHRTKLAILLSLSHGHLNLDGQEISAQVAGRYYFDPRLIIRALEQFHAESVEVGLTGLGPRRAILSIIDRQPDCVLRCALSSIGLDTQHLVPPPQNRKQ
jgi:hypothetical protein